LEYSVAEAAALLSVGRTTIYELIGSGSLRTIKIGSRRLVARRDLEDFVAGLRGERRDAG
jgi:excisionase family DNA binding protein